MTTIQITQYKTYNVQYTVHNTKCKTHPGKHIYNSSLSEDKSLSFHIHINIFLSHNQIIPNRTELLIASKHISRHALVIMKQTGLRCMLSSDCTKASNPFRGLHFLINPRNWQGMNNLTYTSRCIDAGGYLRLFSGIFLLQDDPTTYHGRIKDWRLGGLANCACAILRPPKQFI